MINVKDKLPPACTEVLVRRESDFLKDRYPLRKRYKFEVYYVGTHPQECVKDDKITHWQMLPVVEDV